jgi:hypothetical protein
MGLAACAASPASAARPPGLVVHERGAEHGSAAQREVQGLAPRARPVRGGELGEALADRARHRPRGQAAVDCLAVQQAHGAEQVALLRVVPDQVEAAVPDGRLACGTGNQVGNQPVRACVNLPGRLAGGRQGDCAGHGLLIDQAAPQQHPGVAGVRAFRVHGGAYRAPGTVSCDHQVGAMLGAVIGHHARRLLIAAGVHGRYLSSAVHRHGGTAQRMRLQPSLQQVPRRGVAIYAMKDGGLFADAGHLPEQVDVHAQAPAAIDGAGGASLEDGHVHAEPGQRDRRGQADQAAANYRALHRTGRRGLHTWLDARRVFPGHSPRPAGVVS